MWTGITLYAFETVKKRNAKISDSKLKSLHGIFCPYSLFVKMLRQIHETLIGSQCYPKAFLNLAKVPNDLVAPRLTHVGEWFRYFAQTGFVGNLVKTVT